jgi:hypothetical protein
VSLWTNYSLTAYTLLYRYIEKLNNLPKENAVDESSSGTNNEEEGDICAIVLACLYLAGKLEYYNFKVNQLLQLSRDAYMQFCGDYSSAIVNPKIKCNRTVELIPELTSKPDCESSTIYVRLPDQNEIIVLEKCILFALDFNVSNLTEPVLFMRQWHEKHSIIPSLSYYSTILAQSMSSDENSTLIKPISRTQGHGSSSLLVTVPVPQSSNQSSVSHTSSHFSNTTSSNSRSNSDHILKGSSLYVYNCALTVLLSPIFIFTEIIFKFRPIVTALVSLLLAACQLELNYLSEIAEHIESNPSGNHIPEVVKCIIDELLILPEIETLLTQEPFVTDEKANGIKSNFSPTDKAACQTVDSDKALLKDIIGIMIAIAL